MINTEIVRDSIGRMIFDPKELYARIDEGNRSRWVNLEQKEQRYKAFLAATGSPEQAQVALERIIKGNDLVGINYLAKGMIAARSVCRLQLRSEDGQVAGFGTGFLVGAGVLMTNRNVLPKAEDASTPPISSGNFLSRASRNSAFLCENCAGRKNLRRHREKCYILSTVSR